MTDRVMLFKGGSGQAVSETQPENAEMERRWIR